MTPTRQVERGVVWYAFESLGAPSEVLAASSTRHGGVSEGGFASLNLGFDLGDAPEKVRENRRRFAEALGFEESKAICAAQVHGNRVVYVDEASTGAGYETPATALPDIDGLVADRPGLTLWLRFADCVPILAYDPVRPAVGIAHAGWRGTLGGIATGLVEALRQLGSRPEDLRVAIGPSIGPCCYEVGPDLVAAFGSARDDADELFYPSASGRRLDLWEANRRLLVRAGVPAEQIAGGGQCTACQVDEFFSHRAQNGHAGRIAAVIGLR